MRDWNKVETARDADDEDGQNAEYPEDLIYLRAGTARVSTSWIPIGDTPASMGGLVYLEGSDALGRRMEAEFAAQNANLAPCRAHQRV